MTRHKPNTRTRIVTPSLDGMVQVVEVMGCVGHVVKVMGCVGHVVKVMGRVVVRVDFNRWDFGGNG